jgi:hypothetical protein
LRFFVPLLLVHLLIGALLGSALSISSDESCSLVTTDGSLGRTIIQSIAFEWQPPAYFVLLWGWRLFSESILWARLLSVALTMGSLVAFWVLAKRLGRQGSQWPIWATAFLAIHPYTIAAAVDIRLYAMGLLLSILQLDGFLRVYVRGETRWRWWYVAVGVLSLYTNMLLGLCLAAQHVTIWLTRDRKQIGKHFQAMVIIGCVYLPMFLYQLKLQTETDTPSESYRFGEFANFVIGSISHNIIPLARVPSTQGIRKLLTVGLSCILLFFWLKGNKTDAGRQNLSNYRTSLSYLILVSFFLLCFLYYANVLTSPRYSYPLVAASVIVWGLFLDSTLSSRWQSALWTALLITAIVSNAMSFSNLSKPGDLVRVSDLLRNQANADQPILCFPNEMETMLARYDHGPGRLIPVVEKQRMDRFLFSDLTIPDESLLQELLDRELATSVECWVIFLDDAIIMSPIRHNCAFLESYLEKHFDETGRFLFSGATVKRFRRKP